MSGYAFIINASEFAKYGASREFLISFLGISHHAADKIVPIYQHPDRKKKIKCRAGFLTSPKNSQEATLWWSCIKYNGLDLVKKPALFLEKYKYYYFLSSKPLSINSCLGICRALIEGHYKITPCEISGIEYISECSSDAASPVALNSQVEKVKCKHEAEYYL